jgi:hypothetical protein
VNEVPEKKDIPEFRQTYKRAELNSSESSNKSTTSFEYIDLAEEVNATKNKDQANKTFDLLTSKNSICGPVKKSSRKSKLIRNKAKSYKKLKNYEFQLVNTKTLSCCYHSEKCGKRQHQINMFLFVFLIM